MGFAQFGANRFVRGIGAFLLADLITGLAAFTVITSAALWYFCFTWIRLSEVYAPVGIHLGSATQLDLAWVGLFACLGPLGAALCLAWDAYRLPRAWIR
jgi:hypothetical protein